MSGVTEHETISSDSCTTSSSTSDMSTTITKAAAASSLAAAAAAAPSKLVMSAIVSPIAPVNVAVSSPAQSRTNTTLTMMQRSSRYIQSGSASGSSGGNSYRNGNSSYVYRQQQFQRHLHVTTAVVVSKIRVVPFLAVLLLVIISLQSPDGGRMTIPSKTTTTAATDNKTTMVVGVQAFSTSVVRVPVLSATTSANTIPAAAAVRKSSSSSLYYFRPVHHRGPLLLLKRISTATPKTTLQQDNVVFVGGSSSKSSGLNTATTTMGMEDSSSSSSSYYNNDPMNNRHSASDWLYNVRSLPESKVLREIRNPVLSVFLWSLLVSILYTTFHRSPIRFLNRVAINMCIPGTAHSFLVSALGLLLVFRTNSAYQRFNEGRKIWEHILSVSRNLSRFLSLYDTEIGYEKQRRIMNLVAAYPYLLRQHIRPGCLCSNNSPDIPTEFRLLLKEQRRTQHETRHEGPKQNNFYNKPTKRRTIDEDEDDSDHDFITPTNHGENNRNKNEPISLFGKRLQLTTTTSEEQQLLVQQTAVEPTNTDLDCWVDRRALPWSLFIPQSLPAISSAENRPLWVCDRMAALICKIPYGPNFTSRERLVLLGMVDKLTNAIGQCERIHQTAVPLNYARHSLRSLTLWLFTLPFALVQDLGLLTAFANAVIAWLFFGVYQIGYSIEDPFQGSLRLSILCDAIRRSVIRQPSTTYPDEDPNNSYSPEECLNIYNTSKDGSIPEECLLHNNVPSLTDVIRRSVKSEESMALSIEETIMLEQKEKLLFLVRQQQKDSNSGIGASTTNTSSSSGTSTSNGTKTLTTSPNTAESTVPKTIWSLDEEMLATPKIVTKNKNGTWTEVGI